MLVLSLTGFLFGFSQNINSLQTQINAITGTDKNPKEITTNAATRLGYLYNQSKKMDYKQGIEDAGIALMEYDMTYGTYGKVIELGNEIRKYTPEAINEKNIVNLHRLLGLAYSSFGDVNNAYKEFHLAIRFAKKIKDDDIRHYLLAKSYQNLTNYFDRSLTHADSILYYDTLGLKEAELINEKSLSISNDLKYGVIIAMQYSIGLDYTYIVNPPDPDLAANYFFAALKINEAHKDKISKTREIDLYNSVSRFYLSRKKLDSAIEYGMKAMQVESIYPSPYKRTVIYKTLSQAYEAENKKDQSLKYMHLLSALNDSLQSQEMDETDKTVKQMVSRIEHSAVLRLQQIAGIAGIAMLVILLIIFMLWRRNNKMLRKKHEHFLETLKTEKYKKNTVEKQVAIAAHEMIAEEQDIKKTHMLLSSSIADETVAKLLSKLEKFENTDRYLKHDISLTSLAHYMGTNQTYLSELIKVHKGKTFSNYINGLKIGHILRKLYEDPVYREYKISHLAEECGFSSRQVFMSVFKKITGVTPSYYIEQLKNEKV
ncbi:MAG: AraC family transcriptional regulator [Arachidicoccus sp.]|nr:AraC family transcriptional regulator [Arachidicoccus sp.]